MDADTLIRLPMGLAPALTFLAALMYLDSYKLVRPRVVLMVIVLGGLVAAASYLNSVLIYSNFEIPLTTYSRYIAPLVEESLKAGVLIWMIHRQRVGFLIDAAIFGFTVGTGFAVVENLYYLSLFPDAHIGVWIVRGFGTAIMHGGCTSIFAMISLTLLERQGSSDLKIYTVGILVATLIHSVFNHFFLSPLLSTLAIMVLLPPLMVVVFQQSERSVKEWLDVGFDADTELLDLITSGGLSESPVGQYIHSLKSRFHGTVMADLICYLRLHVELAMRAKGVVMMRENGFEVEIDPLTRESFEELRYLEDSIGATGKLALKPFLQMSRKDLAQLYMLDA
jgi:protease PrsW